MKKEDEKKKGKLFYIYELEQYQEHVKGSFK